MNHVGSFEFMNLNSTDTVFLAVALLLLLACLAVWRIFKKNKKDKKIKTLTQPPPVTENLSGKTLEVAPRPLISVLEKTRILILDKMKGVFLTSQVLRIDEIEKLEEILYSSDLGSRTVEFLLHSIQDKLETGLDIDQLRLSLRSEMLSIFKSSQVDPSVLDLQGAKMNGSGCTVWLVCGVNGSGKTTTIGKLAKRLAEQGKKVLVVCADTFRAAADEQLRIWSERAKVQVFSPIGVKDPSAVAYEACQQARAKGFDIVIIDSAGRLHTQKNLMEELKKMKRSIAKILPGAPHETLLVVDANSGQNALAQAQSFHEALELTGVILTKLDGSSKGGVAVAIACELRVPIKMIGVGEGVGDLRPFSATEFVESII